MKRIISIFALGAALMWVSCTKEGPTGVNTISDLYTVPAGAVEMSAPTATSTWSTDRRYFDLAFGNDLTTTLVGYDALLAPGQYILGADEVGKAILAKTKVGGQPAKSGFITVGKRDAEYQITAQVDGEVLYWKGSLPFQADPAPTALSEVMSAQSNLGSGVNSLTMNLATPGIAKSYDENWQEVWTGEGGYLALDIYSEDGYLHDGSYKASAEGGVINPGEFGIGYDAQIEWDGQVYSMPNWGTCWWDVKDGAATATKITAGLVSVSSEEVEGTVIWTISWGAKYPLEVLFTGAIPALTKPKKPEGPVQLDYTYTIGELMPCSTSDGTVVAGVYKNPVIIVDAAGNEKAYLELVLPEGETNLAGEFVSTEYASAAGQLANGYYLDFGEWGVFAGGSYYVDDAGNKVYIDPGVTVIVTQVATGAYRFTSTGFDLAAAGPDYDPSQGGGEEGDDDVTGDVVLKITSGLTYAMEDVTASNTAEGGAALSGMTLWRVTVTDGAGTVAAFDLGTDEGKQDLSGTYSVMSYPNAPGKAGNGWGFAAFNMFGGCYYLVDGKHYFLPNDATLTVSANADGTLKFKAVGTFQDEDYANVEGGLLLNNVAKQ